MKNNKDNLDKKMMEARQLFLARTDDERRLLQILIDSISDEVWFCDADTNLTMLNKAAFEGLGLKNKLEVVQPLYKLLTNLEIYNSDGRPRPPEDAPLLRSLEGAILKDVEEWVRHPKTGEISYRLVNSAPIRTENGTNVGAIALVRDITEFKLTQDQLRTACAELSVRERIASLFSMYDKERVFIDVLDILLDEFSSESGYIGYYDKDGNLVCPSQMSDIWERCRVPDKQNLFPRHCWEKIWDGSRKEPHAIVLNQGIKLPDGHVALANALAVPILLKSELIGQIVLGNKPDGYRPKDADELERISLFVAPILKTRIEKDLSQKTLQAAAQKLEQQNIALNVLLDNRNTEKRKLIEAVITNVKRLVLPYFEEAKKTKKFDDLMTLLEIIERNVNESIQVLEKPSSKIYHRLTATEIQIADLIKSDKSSKEISSMLNMSLRSVYFHSNNIRRKLRVQNRKTNLRSYLLNHS